MGIWYVMVYATSNMSMTFGYVWKWGIHRYIVPKWQIILLFLASQHEVPKSTGDESCSCSGSCFFFCGYDFVEMVYTNYVTYILIFILYILYILFYIWHLHTERSIPWNVPDCCCLRGMSIRRACCEATQATL